MLPPNVELRDPLDFKRTNEVLQTSILDALSSLPSQEYGDFRIEVGNVRPLKRKFSKKDEKNAVLRREELSIPVKGQLRLYNKETNELVDKKNTTLMRIPWMSNRGTYIRPGGEYTLAFQKRLRPGVYTRKTNTGEFETFTKTRGGTGYNFIMDPTKGQLYFKMYNSKIPAYSVLRGAGMSNDEIKDLLGDDLYKTNWQQSTETHLKKLWKKLDRYGDGEAPENISEALIKRFEQMELDPDSTRRTLGKEYSNVNKDVLKDSVTNLLKVYRGEAKEDNRDSLSFQEILGPEDYFREGIQQDKSKALRKILWKAQKTKNLQHAHTNTFGDVTDYVFNTSRLGQSPEEPNLLDAIDGNVKITSMGTGGFTDTHGVPEGARFVSASQMGLIDPIRSPEGSNYGVDGRLADGVRKGSDGRLYTQFLNMNGEEEWVSSSEIEDYVIAFPGEIEKVANGEQNKVRAASRGKLGYVSPKEVNYIVPVGQNLFSMEANLIPYISGVKGMRGLMGCLHPNSNVTILKPSGKLYTGTIKNYVWEKGDRILSMDDITGAVTYEEIRAKVPNYERIDLYKVTLNSGRQLITTANHKWMVYTAGLKQGASILVPVTAENLMPGTYTAILTHKGWVNDGYNDTYSVSIRDRMELLFKHRLPNTITRLIYFCNRIAWLPTLHVPKEVHKLEGGRACCDQIIRVKKLKRKRTTYDLDLNDKTFLANGIFVHNSKYSVTGNTTVLIKRVDGSIYYGPVESYQFNKGDTTISIKDGKHTWLPVDKVSSHATRVRLFEVTTKGGRKVCATEHHSFVRFSPGKGNRQRQVASYYHTRRDSKKGVDHRLEKVLTEDLKVGDRLPSVTKFDLPEPSGYVNISIGGSYPISLDERTAYVLGIVYAVTFFAAKKMGGHVPRTCVRLRGAIYNDETTLMELDRLGIHMTDNTRLDYTWLQSVRNTVWSSSLSVLSSKERVRQAFIAGICAQAGSIATFSPNRVSAYRIVTNKNTSYKERELVLTVLGSIGSAATLCNSYHKGRKCIRTSVRLAGKIGDRNYGHIKLVNTRPIGTNRNDGFIGGAVVTDIKEVDASLHPVVYDLHMDDNMFWCAGGLIVHNTNQALSLEHREVPRVQTKSAGGLSNYDRAGELVGAVRAKKGGVVVGKGKDYMDVEYTDGETERIELYHNMPLNRKSMVTQTPILEPGQTFSSGDAIVDSNFTRNGTLSLGAHLRAAYMPFKSRTHEDSSVISESAAEKLTSIHAYTEKLDLNDTVSTDMGKFMSIFGGKYKVDQLEKMGDDGIIKPGTMVEKGDPLIINMERRSNRGEGMIGGGEASKWRDNTITWEHESPGEITDVWFDNSGIKVAAKAKTPMKPGDKLCFTPDHDILTINKGWVPVEEIRPGDTTISLNIDTLKLEDTIVMDTHAYPCSNEAIVHINHPEVSTSITKKHTLPSSYDGVHFDLHPVSDLIDNGEFWILSGNPILPIFIDVEEHVRVKQYNDWVYCPTLDKCNTLLVRHNKTCHWSGNSGLFGNKGIVSLVVAEDKDMPQDKDGRPMEMLINPFGVIGRHNPSQVVEMLLSKVAGVTGKNYVLDGFTSDNIMDFVESELKEHGVEANEALTLPEGRTLPSVLVGDAYMYKLHHLSEDKSSGVGAPGYSMSGVPTTVPGGDKPKRIGTLEVEGLLAHGATDVLRDIKMIRGTENREYFKDLMDGKNPPMPKISPVYKKFISTLQSAGIRVKPTNDNKSLQLTAMTDNDVDGMSAGEITKGESVKWKSTYSRDVHGDADLTPIDGGLFDRAITGGMGGNRFSHISLPVKLPQPVFEKQIRTLLDLKERELHGVLSGTHKLDGFGTGPSALEKALKHIDVDKEMESASSLYKASDKPSIRDTYAKKIRALKGIKGMGVKPSDLMVSKVLVIPPVFRPISITPDFEIISDANMLYQDLTDASDNYKQLSELAGSDLSGEALDNMYKAYKAVTGLGEPVKKERVQKHVQGLLKDIFGPSGNKTSVVQRNLIGTPTSFSARGVITPDVNLSMDEIGLPEEKMWELFEPFIVRRLMKGVDKSDPVGRKKVLEDVKERRGNARQALLDEAKERPVVYSRAPVLHKYGVLAGFAQPVPGNAIRVSPITEPGLNADHDGDACSLFLFFRVNRDFFVDLNLDPDNIDAEQLTRRGWFSVNDRLLVKEHSPDGLKVFACHIKDFPKEGCKRETLLGKNGDIDVYNVPAGVEVASYDEVTRKLKWQKAATWSVHKEREVEVVNLKNGMQIITDDDPRAVFGINSISGSLGLTNCTPAEALNAMMLVPVRKKSLKLATESLEEYETYMYDYNTTSMYENTAESRNITMKNVLKEKIPLTKETGYYFGATVGDGWSDCAYDEYGAFRKGPQFSRIVLSNIDKNVLSGWIEGAEYLFEGEANIKAFFHDSTGTKGTYGQSHKHTIIRTALSRLTLDMIGKAAQGKHLPPWYFSANKEHKLGLLAGLIDTDGTVCTVKAKSKKEPQLRVVYHTANRILAEQIKLLCETLGVSSALGHYIGSVSRNDMWQVEINAKGIQELGLVDYLRHPVKRDCLVNFKKIEDTPASTRHDLVPITGELLAHIKTKVNLLGLAPKCSTAMKNLKANVATAATPSKFEGYLTRALSKRIVDSVTASYIMEHPQGSTWLKLVRNSDITWSPVHSVDKTGAKEDLYDITVPGYENYCSVTGYVQKNTFNYHALVSPEAVENAKDTMLPSRHLFSESDFKLFHQPDHEFKMGLYRLGQKKNKGRTIMDRSFGSPEAVMEAYRRGEINLEDEVVVDEQ